MVREDSARFPISIHALREEGDGFSGGLSCLLWISIHALREEGDGPGFSARPPFFRFLSTPSARRATSTGRGSPTSSSISIHALREEGDGRRGNLCVERPDFYPRPPRGGRPAGATLRSRTSKFLSTPSARRATIRYKDDFADADDFYPRPPRGGRRVAVRLALSGVGISIHALREEGDL